MHFLFNESGSIMINISLNYIPRWRIEDEFTLVQVIAGAWRHQAITWANNGQDRQHHIAVLVANYDISNTIVLEIP